MTARVIATFAPANMNGIAMGSRTFTNVLNALARYADGDREREAAERLVECDPRVPEKTIPPVPALDDDRGRCGHDEARDVEDARGRLPHEQRGDQRHRRDEPLADHAAADHRSARRVKISARTSSLAALNRGSNSVSIVR